MKLNSKNIFIPAVTALFLSACGGGSESSFKNAQTIQDLELDIPVRVYEGDTLTKNDENTTINVSHEIENDIKIVTLLSGSATLLRGELYELAQ
ncbi:MAG: hypothetical protein U9Q33_03770 [Campylobacterota bacterium]|nr:hypothetical protein [Campylobacterota bacterium]